MKNEDFDEAIRQKLEGLDQSYSEADVDKVFRHVTKPPGGFFHWLGRHWYVPVLSVAALVGISYLAIMLLGPDKPVNEQAEVVKPSTEVKVERTAPSTEQKEATTAKEVKRESDQSLSNVSQSASVSGNSKPEQYSNKSAKKGTTTLKNESPASVAKATGQKKDIIAQTTEKTVKLEETTTLIPSIKEVARTENAGTKETPAISKTPEPVPDAGQVTEAANAAKPGMTNASEENKAVAKETSKPESQSELKLDGQPSRANEQGSGVSGKTKMEPAPKEKGKDPLKPGWDWSLKPQSGFRIAGTLPLSNQSIGGSFTGEKLFGKHFGVSMGIAYNSTFTEKFTDKKDLDRRSHHPVDPHMDDRLGGDEHPTNISIHNTIYQLPLHISYYQQLKPGVAFSLSAGTDIDFFVKQNILFDNSRDSIHGERHHFQNNGTVDPFNSIVISAGMEKQWKRLGLMIQPFIVPHLKKVFYKPKEFEYGFGIQLNYSLFK